MGEARRWPGLWVLGNRKRRAAGIPLLLGMAGLAGSALLAGQAGAAEVVAARPGAPSATEGTLNGVTCVSGKDCVAVGQELTSRRAQKNLAEKWNGTRWSAVNPPQPAGSRGGTLNAVSCPSAKNCIAVGDYFKLGKTIPQADRWNGSKWTSTMVPAPASSGVVALDGVACVSAGNCWASGQAGRLTLVEHWNGNKWSRVSSPSPHPAKPNLLSGMACPGAHECWAVGLTFPGNFSGSLTERWTGSKWTVVRTPTAKTGELAGDACARTSACMAVGISNNLFPIAQRWTGSAWVATTVPKFSGEKNGDLTAVACPSRAACVAVGNFFQGKVATVLAEKWNGSKWAATKAKAPAGSSFATLQGVACTSARNCWAAGEFFGHGSASFLLIEHWNGKAWSVS